MVNRSCGGRVMMPVNKWKADDESWAATQAALKAQQRPSEVGRKLSKTLQHSGCPTEDILAIAETMSSLARHDGGG
jgi:hypothetical protein